MVSILMKTMYVLHVHLTVNIVKAIFVPNVTNIISQLMEANNVKNVDHIVFNAMIKLHA